VSFSERARGWLIGASLLAGCEFDRVGIPRTEAFVAMHAVLSASATTQVVLLERTRNGSVFIIAPPFDLADPIMSDEGIAETGAIVRLITPAGDTLPAREDNTVRGDGKGRGIYRVSLPGSALERGVPYRLVAQTIDGASLSAETTVPDGAVDTLFDVSRFDRSRDTVVISWANTPGARAYYVRIETPFGPRAFFTTGTSVRLTGDLRNTDVDELPRVFFPGFPQAVTVSAVDSNFYDWYRTSNNTLTGTGLVNRVDGGLGVFGSLVRLHLQELLVVTPQIEPVAGTFHVSGTPLEVSTTPYLRFDLFVESRATRAGQGDALSGSYDVRPRFGYAGCLACGLLGTVKDNQIQLALLRDWTATDTVEVFTGELRGDTIVGSYRGFGGPVRFVKHE
jgi:hypothetical protein